MKKLTLIKWKQLVIFLILVKSINSYAQDGGPIISFGSEKGLVYDVGYANVFGNNVLWTGSLEYERYSFNKNHFQGPKIHVSKFLFSLSDTGSILGGNSSLLDFVGVSTGASLSYLQGNNQWKPLLKAEIGLNFAFFLDFSYTYSIGNVDDFFPSNYNRSAFLFTINVPFLHYGP